VQTAGTIYQRLFFKRLKLSTMASSQSRFPLWLKKNACSFPLVNIGGQSAGNYKDPHLLPGEWDKALFIVLAFSNVQKTFSSYIFLVKTYPFASS